MARVLTTFVAATVLHTAPVSAAFPGERGLIAFSRDDQIYTVNPDGSELRQLTSDGINKSPAWSADGERLVWACDDDLCISSPDGSDVQRLTGPTYDEQRPSWSPDGEWIVFTRRDPRPFGAPTARIFKVEVANPENVVQLTDFESTDPEWSPDGRHIIFLKGSFHAGYLWKMRPDGSRAKAVNNDYAQGATPSWSPDGERIAFLAKIRDRWRIAIVSRRGRLIREFFASATALGITWSPDGRRLAYIGAMHDQEDLVVIKPNGSDRRLLGGQGRAPDWQPV